MKSRRITLMIDGTNVKAIKEEQAKQIRAQSTNPNIACLSISFSKVANQFLKCGINVPRKRWDRK